MKHFAEKSPTDWTGRQKDQWQKSVAYGLREAIADLYGKRSEYRFAKAIGISQGSLSDILNGHSMPSAYTLVKMSSVLGLDVGGILGGC